MALPDEIYKHIIRPFLFSFEAEKAHEISFKILHQLDGLGLAESLISLSGNSIAGSGHEIALAGLSFPNRIGLAAGFDKNARLLPVWGYMGFGHIELGTITPRPQAGNPKPRLFRLQADEAIINRMGFNNDGMELAGQRLEHWQNHRPSSLKHLVIGANIGKNKDTPNETADEDYALCFERLYGLADYFTLNISSPNTPGLRALQEADSIKRLVETVQNLNHSKPKQCPIFLKLAPDFELSAMEELAHLVLQLPLDGIILTNTTISREGLSIPTNELMSLGAGGLSGKPLCEASRMSLACFKQVVGDKIPLISVGGIHNTAEAQSRIDSGAALIQVYTGLIYQGPGWVKHLSQI